MRLRKQLLFLSLITLSLPWAGCQYIREMDASLRRGQSEALQATAQAVVARLRSDEKLLAPLKQSAQVRHPIYANALRSPISMDGYDDDWISHGYPFIQLPGHPHVQSSFGKRDGRMFAMLKVSAKKLSYYIPTNATIEKNDRVEIGLGSNRYALFASAPGALKAIRMDDTGTVNDKVIEYQIQGHWLEWDEGFQVEFSLPWEWLNQGMWVNILEGESAETTTENKPNSDWVPIREHILAESDQLTRELEIFASTGLRLHLTSTTAHKIAHAGSLQLKQAPPERHGFLEWLYALALGKNNFPKLADHELQGHTKSEDVNHSLAGYSTTTWYRDGRHTIGRVALPIYAKDNTTIIGSVVAEKSAETLANVTNTAFSRLLAYSFLVSSFAALSLVMYATWLSFRIRKLSAATANAVSESGKIQENFPVSNSADELGELSRNYAQLLHRLSEYTHYLRTLSSKLSHELRTPLAIVRSSLDNLEHERLSRQAKIYTDRAREGATRLSNILNSMSAASRVEQAIGSADRELIPCDEILESLAQAYADVYPNINIGLDIKKHPKGFTIYGSGELLVQAFDKLVDNAADFCPEDGSVELGLYRDNDIIVFTVRNEGPPLPQHMHGQLFDSMVSVREKPDDDESHHLGLGLYIVRLITDFHHGEVNAYNIPDNSGVIFEVKLPTNTQASS